jgi:small multidrug resistance pump
MIAHLSALALAVALTAVSQLLLKLGATRAAGDHWLRTWLNPHTVTAYVLLLATTLLTTYAYKTVPLKLSVVVLPFNVILIGLLSWVVLEERLSKTHAIGSALVVLGIAVYNAGLL